MADDDLTSVTGLTAERMLAIEAASVVSGSVQGDDLILETHDGTTIDAGDVRGPQGIPGPAGQPLLSWPVGSIFMSTVATNPATLLGGGTWAAWGTGRVPVAIDTTQTEFNTVEKTGGEKTHTLTTNEMPSHAHIQNAHTHTNTLATATAGSHRHNIHYTQHAIGTSGTLSAGVDSDSSAITSSAVDANGDHTHAMSGSIASTTPTEQNAGGGAAHNNLQPYITCYMWKRTA